MIPHMLTTVLQRYDPYLAYLYNKSVTHHDSFVNPKSLRPRCLPLVLRWAPELNCLGSLYRNIMASVDVQTALDDVWPRRCFSSHFVAWKNAGPHLKIALGAKRA